ncbi:unnamed protein product [Protopolystoma xenopodis]|uniref:ADAM10 cysteine-rich domain-containing protein n=1 Tax=Protopolystoma xenopodis TaxID=117903 RepID=A0A448XCF4_9PLAT|nr:unnamed protein product [Protopolystoma xenopodis]
MSAELLRNRKGIKLKPGAPCDNYRGYCDVFLRCRSVEAEGPLARLRNLLFSPLMLNKVKTWITLHWWAVIIICLCTVIAMIVFVKICAFHTPPSHLPRPPLPTAAAVAASLGLSPTIPISLASPLPQHIALLTDSRRLRNQEQQHQRGRLRGLPYLHRRNLTRHQMNSNRDHHKEGRVYSGLRGHLPSGFVEQHQPVADTKRPGARKSSTLSQIESCGLPSVDQSATSNHQQQASSSGLVCLDSISSCSASPTECLASLEEPITPRQSNNNSQSLSKVTPFHVRVAPDRSGRSVFHRLRSNQYGIRRLSTSQQTFPSLSILPSQDHNRSRTRNRKRRMHPADHSKRSASTPGVKIGICSSNVAIAANKLPPVSTASHLDGPPWHARPVVLTRGALLLASGRGPQRDKALEAEDVDGYSGHAPEGACSLRVHETSKCVDRLSLGQIGGRLPRSRKSGKEAGHLMIVQMSSALPKSGGPENCLADPLNRQRIRPRQARIPRQTQLPILSADEVAIREDSDEGVGDGVLTSESKAENNLRWTSKFSGLKIDFGKRSSNKVGHSLSSGISRAACALAEHQALILAKQKQQQQQKYISKKTVSSQNASIVSTISREPRKTPSHVRPVSFYIPSSAAFMLTSAEGQSLAPNNSDTSLNHDSLLRKSLPTPQAGSATVNDAVAIITDGSEFPRPPPPVHPGCPTRAPRSTCGRNDLVHRQC